MRPPREVAASDPAEELTDERGRLLPALAREALGEALGPILDPAAGSALCSATDPAAGRSPFAAPAEPWLLRPAATFVSLHQGSSRGAGGGGGDRRLRGCIGSVRATRPLVDDLCENARAAALDDPRFPPLTAAEAARDPVAISVSVLSPLAAVAAASEEELVALLRPGVDGLVLEWGRRSGTFLPQVWRELPEPADFLAQLRRKAGLTGRFWAPELRLWRFTVRSWTEG